MMAELRSPARSPAAVPLQDQKDDQRAPLLQPLEPRLLLSAEVPGMAVVSAGHQAVDGQLVYLDFDGQEAVTYRGPFTTTFDVAPFRPNPECLVSQTARMIAEVVKKAGSALHPLGIEVTTTKPADGGDYSTVWIGGDGAPFASLGHFRGLAEKVDAGNQDHSDNAFVFSDNLRTDPAGGLEPLAAELARVVVHEVGHLLGYAHEQERITGGELSHLADTDDVPSGASVLHADDESYGGGLLSASDVDWWRTAVTHAGTLKWRVYSLPSNGPVLSFTAYPNSQQTSGTPSTTVRVDRNDNESFSLNVSAGTYYLRIGMAAGEPIGTGYYRVRATFTPGGSALPAISIADLELSEGDSDETDFDFPVALSEPVPEDVTVHYRTAADSAGSADFIGVTDQTVTIPAGRTSAVARVQVRGDTSIEGNETFHVDLFSPSANVQIASGGGRAAGIIRNDDVPTLSISDRSLPEGDDGTRDFDFTVSLSQATAQDVTVHYTTVSNTAEAGVDYVHVDDRILTIPSRSTGATARVEVCGDTALEEDQTFYVDLFSPSANTTIATGGGRATGTIENDDGSVDDHADTRDASATERTFQNNQASLAGKINSSGDVDVFRFVADLGDLVSIEASEAVSFKVYEGDYQWDHALTDGEFVSSGGLHYLEVRPASPGTTPKYSGCITRRDGTGTTQVVALNWSEECPRHWNSLFELPWSGGSMPTVDSNDWLRDGVLKLVKRLFWNAGISHIAIANGNSRLGSVVYFTDQDMGSTGGVAYKGGWDPFNRDLQGEILVHLPWYLKSDHEEIAETVAHEIGHLLGLIHVEPPGAPEIMMQNKHDADDEQFNDVRSFGSDLILLTHNPVYHMRRSLNGETNGSLAAQGTLAGTYDQLSEVRAFQIDLDAPVAWLYDVSVMAVNGQDAATEIARFEEISTERLSSEHFLLPRDAGIRLVGASRLGGEIDTVLATGDPAEIANQLVYPRDGSAPVYLQRVRQPGESHDTLASGVVSSASAESLKYDWSTFLGGAGDLDEVSAVAVGPGGGVYVAGNTDSEDLPTSPGAHQPTYAGGDDAFVARFDPDGTLDWCTYLGGSGRERVGGIGVDEQGSVFVTGSTESVDDFPLRNAPFPGFRGGLRDVFLAKFDASGTLRFSTYVGGSAADEAYGLAVNSAGGVIVGGRTFSDDFSPISAGAHRESRDAGYGFLAQFDAVGSPQWGTFLERHVMALGVGDSDGAVVAGTEWVSSQSSSDVVVRAFNSTGQPQWSTQFGGSSGDTPSALAVDPFGDVIVGGTTISADFPTTPGALDESYNGDVDGFLTKLAPGGAIQWSTVVGTGPFAVTDSVHGVATDENGFIYATGRVSGTGLPVSPDACQAEKYGQDESYLLVLSPEGELGYGTYFGSYSSLYGPGTMGHAVAVCPEGSVYVGGETPAHDFPTTMGAHDTTYNGGQADGWLASFTPAVAPAFGSDSADFSTVLYAHVGEGSQRTYAGQGAYTGASFTQTFTTETLLGISCLRMDQLGAAAHGVDQTSVWGARDVQGRSWLFKAIVNGQTLLEADSLAKGVPFGASPLLLYRLIAGQCEAGTLIGDVEGSTEEIISTGATLPQYPGLQFILTKWTSSDGTDIAWTYYHQTVGGVLDLWNTAGNVNGDGWALSGFAGMGGAPVSLSAPAQPDVPVGQVHQVQWTGGTLSTTLDLWHYGPAGWHAIARNVPANQASSNWNTAGAALGWYWVHGAVRDENGRYAPEGNHWIRVVSVSSPPAPAGVRGSGPAAVTTGPVLGQYRPLNTYRSRDPDEAPAVPEKTSGEPCTAVEPDDSAPAASPEVHRTVLALAPLPAHSDNPQEPTALLDAGSGPAEYFPDWPEPEALLRPEGWG